MRVVYDDIAGGELQRVDDVLAPSAELLHLPGVVPGGTAVELALAEYGDLGIGQFESCLDGCLNEVRDSRLELLRQFVDDAAGIPVLAQRFGGSLHEPPALRDHHDGPAVLQPVADMVDGPVDVAREVRNRVGVDTDVVARRVDESREIRLRITGRHRSTRVEGAEGPPRACAGGRTEPRQREKVARIQVDRSFGARRCGVPRRIQELAIRFDQAHRA